MWMTCSSKCVWPMSLSACENYLDIQASCGSSDGVNVILGQLHLLAVSKYGTGGQGEGVDRQVSDGQGEMLTI